MRCTNETQKCHARGPMKVADNSTTRKDINKNQTKNIFYDQKSMSIIKKFIKSNSYQIKTKTKQINL